MLQFIFIIFIQTKPLRRRKKQNENLDVEPFVLVQPLAIVRLTILGRDKRYPQLIATDL